VALVTAESAAAAILLSGMTSPDLYAIPGVLIFPPGTISRFIPMPMNTMEILQLMTIMDTQQHILAGTIRVSSEAYFQ
jgi:hypothetical protein